MEAPGNHNKQTHKFAVILNYKGRLLINVMIMRVFTAHVQQNSLLIIGNSQRPFVDKCYDYACIHCACAVKFTSQYCNSDVSP